MQLDRDKNSFQQMLMEQLQIHMQRNGPRYRSYTYTKFNSKLNADLNVKHKAIKIL